MRILIVQTLRESSNAWRIEMGPTNSPSALLGDHSSPVPSISITNEGFTSNVNQNAQQTFDFKSTTGELKIYEGAMP